MRSLLTSQTILYIRVYEVPYVHSNSVIFQDRIKYVTLVYEYELRAASASESWHFHGIESYSQAKTAPRATHRLRVCFCARGTALLGEDDAKVCVEEAVQGARGVRGELTTATLTE